MYNGGVVKLRIDKLLTDRGLVESLSMAQRMVMAGRVRANDQIVLNPATLVDLMTILAIEQRPRFVSRGGEKLNTALQAFAVVVSGCACADVGASTGGFTDCLLQNGARLVYAIDVGHGILDWKLRRESRVVVMEDTNARHVERLPEAVSLVTVDASFISLKALLPVVKGWLTTPGEVIALIKPQFEASRVQAARVKGVIRDPHVHRMVLLDILNFSQQEGYDVRAILRSPLLGQKGNTEFFAYLAYPGQTVQDIEIIVTRFLKPADQLDET